MQSRFLAKIAESTHYGVGRTVDDINYTMWTSDWLGREGAEALKSTYPGSLMQAESLLLVLGSLEALEACLQPQAGKSLLGLLEPRLAREVPHGLRLHGGGRGVGQCRVASVGGGVASVKRQVLAKACGPARTRASTWHWQQ